ncbi:MAG: nucleotidyltransferase domain-containing protein [Bacteroidota bacterium]|nr:nucleotidyltransferase domain-containing protein [Bacteroidota bacterium]
MNIDLIIKEVINILRIYLSDDYKIYLFGSWMKGNALPTSGIDIGVLGKKQVDWSVMAKILDRIESLKTLRKIDIVDLFSKDETFRTNVLKSSRILSNE